MTYDHWKTTEPGPASEPKPEYEPEPGSLRLVIERTYPGRYLAHSSEYTGDGDLTGSGRSIEEAAADFAEQYADHEVVAMLDQAWDEINVLGGSYHTPHPFGAGYNKAIADALELIEKLGGRSLAQRQARARS